MNLRQTERLLDGFESLSTGEYDRRLNLAASEEWEQISDGFATLAADLSARERALETSEQRLTVLNRVLRHNLRNRLTVVLSCFEMIRDAGSDDAELADWADRGTTASRRLEGLARTAGRVQTVLAGDDPAEPIRVDPLVREAAEAAADAAPEATVDVDADPTVAVARPSVADAVEELVANACEHGGDTPTVAVTVEERDGPLPVAIRVSDDGPGIPEYERSVIEQGTETDLEHGSGLGLWLAYWVADRCDGELTFPADEAGGCVELRLRAPSTDDQRE